MDSRLSPYPGLRARHLHSSGRGWWLTGQRVRCWATPTSCFQSRAAASSSKSTARFKVGLRLPGVVTVATVRGHGEKVFVAVHSDTPRGVRVRLADAPRDEWIVGCADPEAVAATLAPSS
jgi:hypothetical protein